MCEYLLILGLHLNSNCTNILIIYPQTTCINVKSLLNTSLKERDGGGFQIIYSKLISLIVFVAVYILIILGLKELAVASLMGVVTLLLLGMIFPGEELLTWNEAWHYIDFDVIALLIGVIMAAKMLRHVGFFRWLGIYIANFVRCDPFKLMIFFTIASALLNSLVGATVVISLVMSIVALEIMSFLELDPRPVILAIIFTVNITGMSTSISSLPTILIASALGLSFWDFASAMWLPSVVCVFILIILIALKYRETFLAEKPRLEVIPISPSQVIPNKKLFAFFFAMFVLMILGFVFGPEFNLKPSEVAIIVASIMLIVGEKYMRLVIREVDWETILSIICLSVLVGSLEKSGLISDLSTLIAKGVLSGRAIGLTLILWLSALISAFIDNVPYTMTMIPALKNIGKMGFDISYLWWALAAGTSLGGNGTIIASYANIVVINEVSKRGCEIDASTFTKLGLPLVLISTVVVNILLLLMYSF